MRVRCVDANHYMGELVHGQEYIIETVNRAMRWVTLCGDENIGSHLNFDRFKPVVRVKMGRAVILPLRWPWLGGAKVSA
jgi:hypothetical protein